MTKDEFKRSILVHIGPGGIKCSCCNDWKRNGQGSGVAKSRSRKKLNRKARARMKASLISIIKEIN